MSWILKYLWLIPALPILAARLNLIAIAAVGLALITAVYGHYKITNVAELNLLKG